MVLGLSVLLSASLALGQNVVVYPARGQSAEQQQRDRYECHSWSVQQTGYDPTTAQSSPRGGALRGGARGAAVGAIGGAIAGDAGKGAAIGAATGGLIGGIRQADQTSRQQQAQDAYNRALRACLSGRGYTVQ